MEQCLPSLEQHKWLVEMLGHDYKIIYKKGQDNFVENALSIEYEDTRSLLTLSVLILVVVGNLPRMAH